MQEEKKENVVTKNIKQNIIEFVQFAVVSLIIVIPIRMFVAQPFIVSGDSMYPTFHDKEYLIVDELSYNLKKIERQDVVIFKFPLNTKKYFIKRIIGMPNEEIYIENGIITIKNKENPEGFVLDEPYLVEPFPGAQHFTTGPDEYFVMGDNRNKSSDSRIWGNVNKDFLTGRAYLRLFPVKQISYLPGALEKY